MSIRGNRCSSLIHPFACIWTPWCQTWRGPSASAVIWRSSRHRPGRHRSRTGSLCSTLLPLCRFGPRWSHWPRWHGLSEPGKLVLHSPPRWHMRTIRLGYVIHFARCSPRFKGIWFTSIKAADAPVLRAEISVLLAKDAIEPVPPADMSMELDSVSQTASFTQECAQSVLNCLKTLSGRTAVPLKVFQKLLGHVGATVAIVPLGCSIWDRLSTGSMAKSRGERGNAVIQTYTGLPQNLQPVEKSFFPSGRSSPGAGIQACCVIPRLGSHVQRACSVRSMDGSPTGLAYQLPRVLLTLRRPLRGKDVLVRTDNMANFAYINRQ